jgi:hypothetical protein
MKLAQTAVLKGNKKKHWFPVLILTTHRKSEQIRGLSKTNIYHGQHQIMKNTPPHTNPSTIQTHNDSWSADRDQQWIMTPWAYRFQNQSGTIFKD